MILAFRGLIQPTRTSEYEEISVNMNEPIFSNLRWISFSPNEEKCDSWRTAHATNPNVTGLIRGLILAFRFDLRKVSKEETRKVKLRRLHISA